MSEEIKQEDIQDDSIPEENIELDLNEFGDMNIQSGGSKPTFDKITKAIVKEAILMTTKDRKETTDKQGNKQTHYPVYMRVVYDVDGNEVYENYGGGRLFVSESTKEKKFWLGEQSALGKLKKQLEDNFDFKGTLKEMPILVKGKSVGIKTTKQTVAGNTYIKNLIEVFYPS